MFVDLEVYVCHDADSKGQRANKVVAETLQGIAQEVKAIELGDEIVEKRGKDVTDWMIGEFPGERESQFNLLMDEAESI